MGLSTLAAEIDFSTIAMKSSRLTTDTRSQELIVVLMLVSDEVAGKDKVDSQGQGGVCGRV